MTTLVVGADFSQPSRKAFDAAIALAQRTGGRIVLVHASSPQPPGSKAGALDPISQVNAEVDAAEVKALSTTWAKEAGSTKVEVVTRPGRAADVLIAVAHERKADYLVVGTHGRSGLRKAVLGSVAQAVVQASKVPVLVVPS